MSCDKDFALRPAGCSTPFSTTHGARAVDGDSVPGIYYRTLYRRIDRGQVPAYKIGRLIRLRVHDLEGEPSPPLLVGVEPTGRILDTASAAAYLGLSEFAFRPLVRSGAIPHTVVGGHGWRFVDHDLHSWLEERARVRPGDPGNILKGRESVGGRSALWCELGSVALGLGGAIQLP